MSTQPTTKSTFASKDKAKSGTKVMKMGDKSSSSKSKSKSSGKSSSKSTRS